MTNFILQPLKKQKLAIDLAQKDCLFVISNLKTFKYQMFLAHLFEKKNNLSAAQKIKEFLIEKQDPILYAMAQEFSARTDFFGNQLFDFSLANDENLTGVHLIRQAPNFSNKDFYILLLRELSHSDFPKFWNQYLFLKKRLDVLCDMRLYGADLESLCERISSADHGCDNHVDWKKTTKEKLYIDFVEECRLTSHLTPVEQEMFAKLFAYGLFEKSVFVSSWYALAVNQFSNVFFIDFDYIYTATADLKKYAINYIKNGNNPVDLEELKLHRALMLLEDYCKDIKPFDFFAPYLDEVYEDKEKESHTHYLLKALKCQNNSNGLNCAVEGIDPKTIEYLLKPQDFDEIKRYWRNSMLLVVGLITIILILIHHG